MKRTSMNYHTRYSLTHSLTHIHLSATDCEVQEAIEAYEQCAHIIHRYAQTYDLSKDYIPTEIQHDAKYAKRHEVASLSEASKAKLANMTSKKHHTRLQKGDRASSKEHATTFDSRQDGHFSSHKGMKYKSQLPTIDGEDSKSKSSLEDGVEDEYSIAARSGDELISTSGGILAEEEQENTIQRDDNSDNDNTPSGLDFDAINAAIMDDGIAHIHKIIFTNFNPSTSYLSGMSSKIRSVSSKLTANGNVSTKFARIGEGQEYELQEGSSGSMKSELNGGSKFRSERRSMKGAFKKNNRSSFNEKDDQQQTSEGSRGSSGQHHWFMTLTFEDSDGNMIHPMQRTCTKDNEGETTIFGEQGDYMDIQIHANKHEFIKNHVSIEIFEHKTMRDVSFGKCQISLQSLLIDLENEQELVPSEIEIVDEKGKTVERRWGRGFPGIGEYQTLHRTGCKGWSAGALSRGRMERSPAFTAPRSDN